MADDPDQLVIDVRTFTAPERLECQIHFDNTFGDLCHVLREAIVPVRPDEPLRLTRDGERVWPDQVAQFMLWVQTKRDDPTVALEDFDHLNLAEVQSAFTRGMLGKAQRPTRSTRSSPESKSASSSEE